MVKLTQEMIDAQIEKAIINTEIINLKEPRSINVYFNQKDSRIFISFSNGSIFSFLTSQVEWLANLNKEIVAEVSLTPCGKGLRWETPDIDLSIQGLLMGIFGGKKWMRECDRLSITAKS